jgi:hypothetical protein
VTGLEALHDAIQHHEGWFPGSVSNRNRNPGNLRASQIPHTIDAGGYCVFKTIIDGSNALLHDLHAKIVQGTHGLTPDSTLDDLFDVYAPRADKNDPQVYAVDVANWLSIALGWNVYHDTKLREVCPELFSEPLPGGMI